jgi:YHS domain-containing protein
MNANTIINLLWFVVIGGLFYFMMRSGGCGHGGRGEDHHDRHAGGDAHPNEVGGSGNGSSAVAHEPAGAAPVDPVCGMPVASTSPVLQRSYMDQTFSFCSQDCMRRFDANPSKYARAQGSGKNHRHAHAC